MLAQLVEQRTFNPFVVGSTPAHPTKQLLQIKKPDYSNSRAFFTAAFGICDAAFDAIVSKAAGVNG